MDPKKKFLERLYDAARDPRNADKLYFHEDGIHLVVSKDPIPEFPKTPSLCRNLNMYRLLVDKEKEPIPGKSIYGLPRHRLGELTRDEFCSIPRRPVKHRHPSSASLTRGKYYDNRRATVTSEEEEEAEEEEEESGTEESVDADISAHKLLQQIKQTQSGTSTVSHSPVPGLPAFPKPLPHLPLPQHLHGVGSSVGGSSVGGSLPTTPPLPESAASEAKRARLLHEEVAAALKFSSQHSPVPSQLPVQWEEEDMLAGGASSNSSSGVGGSGGMATGMSSDFSSMNFAKLESGIAKHFAKVDDNALLGGGASGSDMPTSGTNSAISTSHSSMVDDIAVGLAWWNDDHHHIQLQNSPIQSPQPPATIAMQQQQQPREDELDVVAAAAAGIVQLQHESMRSSETAPRLQQNHPSSPSPPPHAM